MEDQGIMALPQAGMQAPTAQPQAAIDPNNFSPEVFDYARMQPDQFGQDIMGGMEAADPAMVAEFKQALAGMQLPPEVIDALGDVIDLILQDPENYGEVRAELIAEGVPEEILPPTFDAAYFAAMNIALVQLSAQLGPVGMASGGIMTLNPIATELAKMGRGGDRMIAHVTPAEARMLRRRGGSGTINPYTGQPEFLKKLVKSVVKTVTQPIKSAAKAVKGVVKGLGNVVKKIAASPIGRIALTTAAIYFMGGAGLNLASGTLGITNAALATGVNAFAGSTLVNLASGQKVGDAIKGGLVTGVLAGVTTGVVKGFDATVPPPSVVGTSPVSAEQLGSSVDSVDAFAGQQPSVSANVPSIDAPNLPDAAARLGTNVGPDLTLEAQPLSFEPNFRMQAGGVDLAQNAATTASDAGSAGINMYNNPVGPGNVGVTNSAGINTYGNPMATAQGADMSFLKPEPTALDQIKSAYNTVADPVKNFYGEYISPERGMPTQDAIRASARDLMTEFPGLSPDKAIELAAKQAAESAPGIVSRYAPIAGIGLGAAYLGGAFKPPEQPGPAGTLPKETGFDLIRDEPGIYGTTPGGANVTYASLPTDLNYNPQNPFALPQITFGNPYANRKPPPRKMFAQGGIAAVAPSKFKLGGYASGGIGSMAKTYPRRTGEISGPGTGTSDDIPAMLSDGEFVMTAKAVRGAGKGSRREGAKRMYAMMRKLEGKA